MKIIWIKVRNLFDTFRYFTSLRLCLLYIDYMQFYILNSKQINRTNINYLKKFKNKSFSKDWQKKNIFFWIKFFNKNKPKKIKNILEIGCFEGMSSLFFLQYFSKAKLTCVDTFKGSSEHIGIINFSKIEKFFISNTRLYKKRIKIHKTRSSNFFLHNKSFFDLIYIDGAHDYKTVFLDAKNSFKILNINGILIFDDYFWRFYKPGKNPINAINAFLNTISGKYSIELVTTQLFIKKISDI